MYSVSCPGILDAFPFAVLVVERDGVVSFLNPAAEELLGTSARYILGSMLEDFFATDVVPDLVRRVREQGHSLSELYTKLSFRHNEEVPANVHVSLQDETGGQVIIAIEHRRYAPAESSRKARQEMMRTSGLMAAMLAHEVKNPLAGIRGAAQLLKQEAEASQKELLALICNEVDRIKGVLAQVEPFSEERLTNPELVNVHEVLQYVSRVNDAAATGQVSFVEDFDPSLPQALASRDRLVQLLLNLVKNASEALEATKGATITLRTTSLGDFRVSQPEDETAAQLHIIIEDNGPGISEAMQTQLFKPFVSGKEKQGRGLGLAIAAKLAESMGGSIALERSRPGCTRFRVSLPAEVESDRAGSTDDDIRKLA